MNRVKRLRKSLWGGAAVSALTLGVIAAPVAPLAGADEITGCSYGTGGPNDKALCWIDMSSFGEVTKAQLADNPTGVMKPLNLTIGNYKFTMNATVMAGKDGAQGVSAKKLPTWGGAVMGNTQSGQDYFKNTSGSPALYQIDGENAAGPLEKDTVKLSDIKVVDTRDNSEVKEGFSLVVADAESTDDGEGFIWKSNSAIKEYQEVVPNTWQTPCSGSKTGFETNEVSCIGGEKDFVGQNRGIMMAQADAPHEISSSFSNGKSAVGGSSKQGVAFAVVFTTLSGGVTVTQDGGSDGSFQVDMSTEGQQAGTASSDGGQDSTDPYPVLSGPEGSTAAYTAKHVTGTGQGAYDTEWKCTVGGEVVTPTLSEDGMTASINVGPNQNGNCEYIAVAKGPKTGNDKEIINPNTTAYLNPQSVKGKGEITDVAFDNGEETKTVPGQGKWTIKLVDGQPQAEFTPEKDYDGPVTPQNYTITDQYGLTAEGKLEVEITKTPVGGFSIAKSLNADVDNPTESFNDKLFNFDYECTDSEGKTLKEGSIELKPGESKNAVESIGEIKEGASCKVTEKDASVANFDWSTKWEIKGGTITEEEPDHVVFEVASGKPGQPVAVGVENIYKAKRGSFDIVKSLSGEAAAAAANTDFKFNYSCVVGEKVVASGNKTITGAGSATVDDVPLVSDCTVTESNATVPGTSLQSKITPSEFKLLDESDKPVEVTVNADNEYTYVDGGFTITKQVEGDAVSFAPDEFTMNYQCEAPTYGVEENDEDKPETKSVELKAGESTTVDDVIPGSKCKVWEDDAPAKNKPGFLGSSTNTPGASWNNYYEVNGVKADPAEFTVESAKTTQVTVTNVYNKEGKNGLIIIPFPIPFPVPGGGSSTPPDGGSSVTPPSPVTPSQPAQPGTPVQPGTPAEPGTPEQPAKGQPSAQAQKSTPSKSLANTGANVAWLAGGALMLLAAGAFFVMRSKKRNS
ncbi:DUF5979 domain-containing protein [Corynebacterium flavescens]|uniref:DUF5979 domain-containing protein n=1 Tax=Corynebacterium flavescens TaxID=28028 RepID=A0AB73B9Y5_CORFL|nr:DUF5979 domain-containing protein [Corynebacterium flavescens]KAA8724759.1 LPXTG cell wall anchor domain-containing protein [Corynebacterium flavescens]GEB98666.1 hypothetical protein CFL01nite_21610 [Corynebacterium flavescens]